MWWIQNVDQLKYIHEAHVHQYSPKVLHPLDYDLLIITKKKPYTYEIQKLYEVHLQISKVQHIRKKNLPDKQINKIISRKTGFRLKLKKNAWLLLMYYLWIYSFNYEIWK